MKVPEFFHCSIDDALNLHNILLAHIVIVIHNLPSKKKKDEFIVEIWEWIYIYWAIWV